MATANNSIKIYRKLVPADTFATLGVTEKIELNVNATDVKIANMWSTKWKKGAPRGIAEHANPNQELSEQQDTGKDEEVWTIDFAIARADLVGNQFLVNLEAWNGDIDSQENLNMPFGRFSVEFVGVPLLNLISDATKGLEIRSIDYDKDEEVQNKLNGVIVLSKGKQAT